MKIRERASHPISTKLSLIAASPPSSGRRHNNNPVTYREQIEECDVFIDVFSPNYASSFFCLDQLSYLLSLPKRLILPLFYDMQPAHVRRQEGAFRGSFFVAHRNIGIEEETMHKWRNSLNEVACISGWDTRNYRYDQLSYIFF
ncbi:hypothetical protein AMTR_s00052p00159410 [Amborella trichopoda]|uniref:ADP-ribosyl cyclase/cyclic ADP-ribose hydrolase n=1 Tax=Amborella trichopoda TaxID=13333 RepID=U5D4S7_AMBTC|nr:hypothetical protein AMTR_s00052p00159410 [Amborella trichopoda]